MLELPKKNTKRPYEAVWLFHPDAGQEEHKKIVSKAKEVIESFAGQLKHVDSWGKRKLANPIGKVNRAYYFYATFESEAPAVAELERTMRINESVLRFLHLRLDEGTDLDKHLERFREILSESVKRDREREAKAQRRLAARAAGFQGGGGPHGGGGGRGPRFDRGERGERGEGRDDRGGDGYGERGGRDGRDRDSE